MINYLPLLDYICTVLTSISISLGLIAVSLVAIAVVYVRNNCDI